MWLYETCLKAVASYASLYINDEFEQLCDKVLKDLLFYVSPYELERIEIIYERRHIVTNDVWRRHFDLVWSLSRDDKDLYESQSNDVIPYKRLYFEYLFHDSQVLQLGIYVNINSKPQRIIDLSIYEHIKYNLSRESVIYCAKQRLIETSTLSFLWNYEWNHYIKRFILIPNTWKLLKADEQMIYCFMNDVTDLVLSGYPTETDINGMKFVLELLTRGNIKSIVLKFPSYCLMNILAPLLIYPRSYSISYLCNIQKINHSDLSLNTELKRRFVLPFLKRKQKMCLQVQLHTTNESSVPSLPIRGSLPNFRQLSSISIESNHSIVTQQSSTDTTNAIMSDSISSRTNISDSIDFLISSPNTVIQNHSSLTNHLTSVETNFLPDLVIQQHNRFQPRQSQLPTTTILSTIVSNHILPTAQIIPVDNNTLPQDSTFDHEISLSTLNQHYEEQLIHHLNRSRTLIHFRNPLLSLTNDVVSTRYIASERSMLSPGTRSFPALSMPLLQQPFSLSDSNIYNRPTTVTSRPFSNGLIEPPPVTKAIGEKNETIEENGVLLHLTKQNQICFLTSLSIYYVSNHETIELLAIALLGMHQINYLTLINIGLYSSQLETNLLELCKRSQLQSLHIGSLTLSKGALGFIIDLYTNYGVKLNCLKMDALKLPLEALDLISTLDFEQQHFLMNSYLARFSWSEKHFQHIHMHLLVKLLSSAKNILRLDISSMLESDTILDEWCQHITENYHQINDLRIRNIRLRPNILEIFLYSLRAQDNKIKILHLERSSLIWNFITQQAFTNFIIKQNNYLNDLNLAYNNLDITFVKWLCEMIKEKKNCWSILNINLNFNIISYEAMMMLLHTLKDYRDKWHTKAVKRIDLLGNALDLNEILSLRKEFATVGCDIIT